MSKPKNGEAAGQQSALSVVMPVVVLVLICLVAGVLLGIVNVTTDPVAQQVAQERANKTYSELVPDAATFSEKSFTTEGVTAALAAEDASGQVIAYIIVAQSKGYDGQVPLAVAFSPEGNVVALQAMKNDETPGIGTKIAEDGFLGQFVGHGATELQPGDVDTITGATISSKAALAAFDNAVRGFNEVA